MTGSTMNEVVLHASMKVELRAAQDAEEFEARQAGFDSVVIPIRVEVPMTPELRALLSRRS